MHGTENAWLLHFVHGEFEVNINTRSAGRHKVLAFVAVKAHIFTYTEWGKNNSRTSSPYCNSLFKSKFKMLHNACHATSLRDTRHRQMTYRIKLSNRGYLADTRILAIQDGHLKIYVALSA
jgi:hypothetical protein